MLLIQGVFRSGTTALFRALRQDERLDCFYEPLHPDLPRHVHDADSGRPSHSKSPLYKEYLPLLEKTGMPFNAESPAWPFHLRADEEATALSSYLNDLVGNDLAGNGPVGGKNDPLLQFNRAFWMAPWLAQEFQGSAIVHLVRDPRSVVWSQLTSASGKRVRMNWPLVGRLLPFTSGALQRVFCEHAYFGAHQSGEYFEKGLQLFHAEQTDPITSKSLQRLTAVRGALPYVKALALWGAQVEVFHRHVQHAFGDRSLLLRYEDFCNAPCKSIQSIYALLDYAVPDPVREYARSRIDTTRLRRWKEVDTAEQSFREGVRRAQIPSLMRELGYDPSQASSVTARSLSANSDSTVPTGFSDT